MRGPNQGPTKSKRSKTVTRSLTVGSMLSSVVLLIIGGGLCAITIPLILAWVPTFQSWLAANGFTGVQHDIFATIPYLMVGAQILVTLALASPVSIRQRPSR